ncbi:GtrA family protein [Clostridium manihotivorum]|uniref:GtrA family protein n=1 Tax=Clostridium manihotivorum TaxID=2320868 RepID=A0A410E050_9CLOT|nr:GtrA family protein [Clostridium manihotivorum]QAA34683.1 GtrA family protein [Clostridium manihotivorum]
MVMMMKELFRFIRFGIVGGMNTLLTFVCFWIFSKLGIGYTTAYVTSYLIGVVNSYFFNSRWVFKVDSKKGSRGVKFLVINLVILAINTCLMMIFVDKVGLNKYIALIIVTGVCMVLNYFLNRMWTFSEEVKNG